MGRLLERDRELAQLAQAVDDAASGRGQMLVIEGPAGVGKTALLGAAGDLATDRGTRVLRARAGELEQTFAFGVCLQLFRSFVDADEASALFAGPGAQARDLLEGHEAAITAATDERLHLILLGLETLVGRLAHDAPVLLVIDDAHWADTPSLQFADYLARRASGLRVCVLLGLRTGEARAEERVFSAIGTERSQPPLVLAPLSPAAVAALVKETVHDADDDLCRVLAQATGGNPFYLRCALEISATRDGRAPSELSSRTIADALVARTGRLGDDAGALVAATAVIGDGLPLMFAAELAGLPIDRAAEAAAALARADLFEPNDRPTFVHPIAREAIYADIPAARRGIQHAQAAVVLHRAGADEEAVAAQLLRAERTGDEWHVAALRAAARRALGRAAPATAVDYLARALDEPPPPAIRWEVVHELGAAEVLAGSATAVDRLRSAFALAPRGASKAIVGRALASALVPLGGFQEAVDTLHLTLPEIAPDDRELALEVEAELATAGRLHPPTHAAATERLQRVAAAAAVTGASPAERLILANLAMARLFSEAPALDVGDPAARALEGGLLDERGPSSMAFCDAIYVLIVSDRLTAAQAICDAALATAQRQGSKVGTGVSWCFRAYMHWRRGDLAAALADARATVEVAQAGGFAFLPMSLAGLLDTLIDQGELAAAEKALAGFEGELPDYFMANFLLVSRARLRLALGDPRAALADLHELQRRERLWRGADPQMHSYRGLMVESLVLLGDDAARELAAENLELARRWGTPRAIGAAWRVAGLAADAVDDLQQAVDVLENAEAPLEFARAQIDLGAALRRRGARTESRAHLRVARDVARGCGALGLASRAVDELKASGGRIRKDETDDFGLTPSELRVARLAADGRTNREIAAALFLSTKTVEMHLHRVYRKLEIGSRRDLVQVMGGPSTR